MNQPIRYTLAEPIPVRNRRHTLRYALVNGLAAIGFLTLLVGGFALWGYWS